MLESPDKTLRLRLEAEMERRGWKKSDLARAAGLSLSTIYPLFDEKQLAWPQPGTLAKLAAGLGTTVAGLFGDPPSPTPQEALAVIARELETRRETPARDQLAERVARLGPDARRALEAMLPGMESVTTGDDSPKQHRKPPEKGK